MQRTIHHLTALDLVIGIPPYRRLRKATLVSAIKAARRAGRAGADRVEVIDGRIVIALAGEPMSHDITVPSARTSRLRIPRPGRASPRCLQSCTMKACGP
jgi:hypothetical protein